MSNLCQLNFLPSQLICVGFVCCSFLPAAAFAFQFEAEVFRGEIVLEEVIAEKLEANIPEKFITDASLLTEHGIGVDRDSLGLFLDELTPSEETIRLGRELIRQLGDERYEVRMAATNQLIRWQGLPGELFDEVLNGEDPEAAFRCRQILEARKSSIVIRLQLAVLHHVSSKKISGLTEKIVTAYPQLISLQVKVAAADAILVSSDQNDIELLKSLVDHEDAHLKVAAIERLLQLDLVKSLLLLKQYADSDDEALRLQIARLYAQLNRAECLDILVDLLNADDATVRGRAYAWLRRVTGHHIVMMSWKKSDERDKSIEQWREWIAANREGLEIDFTNSAPKIGRILVGLYSGNKVVEYDMTGKKVWEAPLTNAFACQGLPNGHRLVSCYSQGRIVEYDAEGNIFKDFTDLPTSISSVERLDNGNTLCAAGQSGNVIFELDPDGKKLWEKTLNGTPIHVQLLESGRMLVSFNGTMEVSEMDRDGKVYWQINLDAKPYSANRLLNGNTLVSLADGGLIEYSPEGEKLREIETGTNTYHGEMMEDGNIIYADKTGIFIIDPSGKKVQSITDFQDYLYLNHY